MCVFVQGADVFLKIVIFFYDAIERPFNLINNFVTCDLKFAANLAVSFSASARR